jgi:uncharacterized protein YaaR (DUF327 family)
MTKGAKPKNVKRTFLESLTQSENDTYRRALDAIALKRRDPKMSLSKAAKSSGTTLKTIRKYAEPAIEVRSGRFDVTPSDRLPRHMRMLTAQGETVVRTTSSRTATRIADYNNALRTYVVTGDPSGLKRFDGKSVRSGGKTHQFATDRRTIDRQARAGGIHFVDIYATGPKQ